MTTAALAVVAVLLTAASQAHAQPRPRGVSAAPPQGLSATPPRALSATPPQGLSAASPRGLSATPPQGLSATSPRGLSATPPRGLSAAPPRALSLIATSETAPAAFTRWDALIETMTRTGGLVLASRRPDRALPGRMHEYLGQHVAGVPVVGGGVSRQTANGATVSIFGAVFDGIDLDPTPALTGADAAARVARQTGARLAAGAAPELVILPLPFADDYRLTWRLAMTDAQTWFVDAATGDVVHTVNAVRTQRPAGPAIGAGDGILGDRKKVAALWSGGRFEARDRIRPAEILTLDLDGADDESPRFDRLTREAGTVRAQDVAADADNDWTDPAVVDGHAHLGFTYDYFAERHGRAGVDDRNGRIIGLVNLDAVNAFFIGPPYGPGGRGVTAFGTSFDGTPIVAGDVVAHEMTHGVVHAALTRRTGEPLSSFVIEPGPARFTIGGRTFTCGRTVVRLEDGRTVPFSCRNDVFQVATNHGGAINEAFADIFGTAVEFFLHEAGDGPLAADYLIGEDVPDIGPFRSLANPGSIAIVPPRRVEPEREIGHPDAYRQLLRFFLVELGPRQLGFIGLAWLRDGGGVVQLPSANNGGVHWNSTILSHAFWLAIEGGMHRTTGVAVAGAGDRQAVEAAFYRALVEMLPPGATLFDAAWVVYQSAVDLYGPFHDVTQAILFALVAVDLLEFAD